MARENDLYRLAFNGIPMGRGPFRPQRHPREGKKAPKSPQIRKGEVKPSLSG